MAVVLDRALRVASPEPRGVTVTALELAQAMAAPPFVLLTDDDTAEVERAAAALTFASELIRRYLGAAGLARTPATVANNAVLRVCGWLREAPGTSASILTTTRAARGLAGQRFAEYPYTYSVDHDHATASPLRASGAMALLSAYKRRRAL